MCTALRVLRVGHLPIKGRVYNYRSHQQIRNQVRADLVGGIQISSRKI